MTNEQVVQRLTIEALRAGVATRSAALKVGTTQTKLLDSFRSILNESANDQAVSTLAFSGAFGAGKSHLLQCLRAEAQESGFVTSFVTIGPEVPPGNLHLVNRALADAAEAKDHVGKATRELLAKYRVSSADFAEFRLWARDAPISDRFRGLLHLFEETRDDELRLRIIGDLEGKPIPKTEVRKHLKELGQLSAYTLDAPRNDALAPERLRLLARYFKSCGQKGWVVLFDEVEVLGRFSLRQRMKAYLNIGQISAIAAEAGSRLVPVFAYTGGAQQEFLADDRSRIENGFYQDESETKLGLNGLNVLNSGLELTKPTKDEMDAILFKVSSIYNDAYGGQVSPPKTDAELRGFQVRTQVRNWITQWDIQRYFPHEASMIVAEDIVLDEHHITDEALPEDDPVN